ncbi:uncharacterized protein LOC112561468 [Pomacea canaliculata]|uniref:uncharacterized protein LOC112561468 n=1 Tax=Pomacea canaliculata TaxID=400727 RepID=UPI000D733BA4|nr:uncharacterized protein LOC112561468 [Pomacea canaliculata]
MGRAGWARTQDLPRPGWGSHGAGRDPRSGPPSGTPLATGPGWASAGDPLATTAGWGLGGQDPRPGTQGQAGLGHGAGRTPWHQQGQGGFGGGMTPPSGTTGPGWGFGMGAGRHLAPTGPGGRPVWAGRDPPSWQARLGACMGRQVCRLGSTGPGWALRMGPVWQPTSMAPRSHTGPPLAPQPLWGHGAGRTRLAHRAGWGLWGGMGGQGGQDGAPLAPQGQAGGFGMGGPGRPVWPGLGFRHRVAWPGWGFGIGQALAPQAGWGLRMGRQ